ncbi:MAG: FtsX-like permease family protein [Gammaproteobacteria bacterium]|nr:FtsX-like permease family protein [Gammaproteobacteria bacterium]MBU1415692.1 FtsX-like permease family protein [Gammaproteobacteria bacterium]
MNVQFAALRLAWRNILRNRRRSLVTILIATVGCLSILVASGFALYTYDMVRESSAGEFGHITVAGKDYFTRDEETPLQYGISDHRELTAALLKEASVKRILPRVSLSGLVSNGDKSVIFLGIGADVPGEAEVRGDILKLEAGSLTGKPGDPPAVLLGVDLAKSLNAKPGTGLTLLATTTSGGINAVDVMVAGIVSTGWREVDKRLVYTDVGTAQHLLVSDRVSTLSVYLDSTDATPAALERLAMADPAHAYQPWWVQAFFYHSVRGLYDRVFGLLGLIIGMLVFFSVVNTLAMAVVERTREIGTMRAMGAMPGEIVAQFLREGALIGAVGALLGTLLAAGIVLASPHTGLQMPPPPGRSVGYPLLVIATLPLYLITNTGIISLCAAAAWFASRKAAKKPIVEALAHV